MEDYTNLDQLRNKLIIDEGSSESDIKARFNEIAHNLLNNFVIRKSKNLFYRILEVECYFFNDNHRDLITYQRSAQAGDWFFHFSGVDICFQSRCKLNDDYRISEYDRKSTYFGGILIRSLEKIENSVPTYIMGKPQLCCDELFDRFTAIPPKDISDFEFPFLEYKPLEQLVKIHSCGRYFNFEKGDEYKFSRILADNWAKDVCPGNQNQFTDFLDEKYRFYYDEGIERYEKWRKDTQNKQTYTARPSQAYQRLKK